MAIVSETEIFRKVQERRRTDLLSSGTVEDLTRQGRVVTAWDCESGERGSPNFIETSIVFIPPQGVSFGDKVWQIPFGGGYKFFYAGKSIGTAETIEVSRGEARKMLQRRDRVLDSIGRKEGPVYRLIDDQERDELG